MNLLQSIKEATDFIQKHITIKPDVGIILGTGLGGITHHIEVQLSLSYKDIPHFPLSTVESHEGRLLFGTLSGKQVVAMQGRFHYYEGYSMQQVTFPVRVLKALGVNTLFISNAAGGLNPEQQVSDLMAISDHINMQPEHPLRGKNEDTLGPRFPDMSDVYDMTLLDKAKAIAQRNGIRLHTGVYVSVSGPTLETPAEYRMLRTMGADAVGMSTVPEVIVARHMNMCVFAVSVITDLGVPGKIHKVSLEDVISASQKAENSLTILFRELISEV
jgi:purine-nucleoside phosphorylase